MDSKQTKSKVSPCGLVCKDCTAYRATMSGNIDAIADITAYWASEFAPDLTTDDVWCEGCQADEDKPLYLYARTCKVRECVPSRGHRTCADCSEYSCDMLDRLLKTMPQARQMLEKIRSEDK